MIQKAKLLGMALLESLPHSRRCFTFSATKHHPSLATGAELWLQQVCIPG